MSQYRKMIRIFRQGSDEEKKACVAGLNNNDVQDYLIVVNALRKYREPVPRLLVEFIAHTLPTSGYRWMMNEGEFFNEYNSFHPEQYCLSSEELLNVGYAQICEKLTKDMNRARIQSSRVTRVLFLYLPEYLIEIVLNYVSKK